MEETIKLDEVQIENIKKVFNDLGKALVEIYKTIKNAFIKIWNDFKAIIEKSQKIKRYMLIYNRTNNRRIKKKQIRKILKIVNITGNIISKHFDR